MRAMEANEGFTNLTNERLPMHDQTLLIHKISYESSSKLLDKNWFNYIPFTIVYITFP